MTTMIGVPGVSPCPTSLKVEVGFGPHDVKDPIAKTDNARTKSLNELVCSFFNLKYAVIGIPFAKIKSELFKHTPYLIPVKDTGANFIYLLVLPGVYTANRCKGSSLSRLGRSSVGSRSIFIDRKQG